MYLIFAMRFHRQCACFIIVVRRGTWHPGTFIYSLPIRLLRCGQVQYIPTGMKNMPGFAIASLEILLAQSERVQSWQRQMFALPIFLITPRVSILLAVLLVKSSCKAHFGKQISRREESTAGCFWKGHFENTVKINCVILEKCLTTKQNAVEW